MGQTARDLLEDAIQQARDEADRAVRHGEIAEEELEIVRLRAEHQTLLYYARRLADKVDRFEADDALRRRNAQQWPASDNDSVTPRDH